MAVTFITTPLSNRLTCCHTVRIIRLMCVHESPFCLHFHDGLLLCRGWPGVLIMNGSWVVGLCCDSTQEGDTLQFAKVWLLLDVDVVSTGRWSVDMGRVLRPGAGTLSLSCAHVAVKEHSVASWLLTFWRHRHRQAASAGSCGDVNHPQPRPQNYSYLQLTCAVTLTLSPQYTCLPSPPSVGVHTLSRSSQKQFWCDKHNFCAALNTVFYKVVAVLFYLASPLRVRIYLAGKYCRW